MSTNTLTSPPAVNWKQVGLFVGLTIVLSWSIDLALWLKFGYDSQHALIFLQLQMLVPAFVAIALQRYVFTDHRLHWHTYQGRPRWFFNFYLFLTVFIVVLVIWITFRPDLYPNPIANLALILWVISVIMLVVIRVASGREAFQKAGLSGGKWYTWILVWLTVIGFLGLQTLLNMAASLGSKPNITSLASALDLDVPAYLVAGFVNSVLVGPLLGLVITFGEEYGWRGYLQGELIKLGRVRGVLLVGLIWGIWHAPVVAMGHNYPGHPVLGPIVFLIFNLLIAIFLGYVMLKTGSVWLVAFAHAVINSAYQWLTMMVYTPTDPLFSFGIGIYGIAFAFLLSMLVLRDRVWKNEGSEKTEF